MSRVEKVVVSYGVVARLGDRFLSRRSLDGNAWRSEGDDDGFGPIDRAEVHDPRYAKKPTDFTYNPSRSEHPTGIFATLERCELVPVQIVTIYSIEGEPS